METSEESELSVPVFAFPASLTFNATERELFKQLLTVYNPYEFPIRFKVLSTTPDHFSIIQPEGSIKPKNCIDLIIRLTPSVPPQSPLPLHSKFRVQVFHLYTKQALGKKDVPTTIFYSELEGSGEGSLISNVNTNSSSSPIRGGREIEGGGQSFNLIAIVTGVLCIIGLMLPSEKDEVSSGWPSYLQLSINQKLLIAYTLGMVTMAIFRP